MSRLLVLFSAAVLPLAIAPAAPIPPPPKTPPLYFPTKVGTKWVYQAEGEKKESVEVVMEVAEKDGAKLVRIGYESKAKMIFDHTISVSEKGLCIIDSQISPLDEPFWLLKLPHKANNKWDVVVAPTVFDPLKGTALADGPEKVDVPAGKFEAIRVKTVLQYDNGQLQITTWYAQQVGKVKEVKDGVIKSVEVLKSFSPGKD